MTEAAQAKLASTRPNDRRSPSSPRLKEEAEIPEALERIDLSYKVIVEWSPKMPEMAPSGPKMAPRAPKRAQDGPRWA